ncbi:uncharacterized protein B0P05DRAFT_539685, partial [Gilbertella persicaria]|uniref:uncharacterized protein n=1 Tax=Gilbertella persicaria TaxID=101096 RepID=UPI0022206625
MPARNTSTTTKKKASTNASKPAKPKPQIFVTSESSPEDILHASWRFLSAYQFFHTFRTYLKLPLTFSLERLENALLHGCRIDPSLRESSISSESSISNEQPSKNLATYMICFIKPLLTQRRYQSIHVHNYDESIHHLFPAYNSFFTLNVVQKIDLLKAIEQAYMELSDEKLQVLKSEDLIPDMMRLSPIGTDKQGWTYWYFGDSRLYREIPIPQGKKGIDMLNQTEFTFQLICYSLESWHNTISVFQKETNKELAAKICDLGLEIIRKLEAQEAARLKNEAKSKRAKELESVPRKRSSRLEVKFDQEAKRQKIIEEEKQRSALEEIERKNKIKQEKLTAQQEERELRVEEARLKNDLHAYLTGLISNAEEDQVLKLRKLRAPIYSTTTEQLLLEKMKGWIELLEHPISVELQDNHVQFKGEHLSEGK